ncbi:hypothetical protein [Streptomyces erythrochromogenes]|uniref:hypothetical protein n=1 Tax=Streptomyces erythrochromogenes TaxID=285574 RepID=UPI00380EFAAA
MNPDEPSYVVRRRLVRARAAPRGRLELLGVVLHRGPLTAVNPSCLLGAFRAAHGRSPPFFQSAEKFKARYATLGFHDVAKLDEGTMWAAGFALTEVTPEVEERIAALVKRAVS